ncbi:MAG TPA: hypothetical protein VI893_08040 [Thermoplasmata archaeon]|nr:hypothetical protein [Thermoplasmata archaeon]
MCTTSVASRESTMASATSFWEGSLVARFPDSMRHLVLESR